jgi:predicted metal-dependent peptidase
MALVKLDQDALSAARLWAANEAPYLATAIFAMAPTALPGLGTMGTDRHWHLYIDPEVFNRWSVEEAGSVLVHEAHHLLRAHGDRAEELGVGPEHQRRFNIAADFEINDDLRELELPGGGLQPESYGFQSGELAETYFALLQSRKDLPSVDCGSGAHGVRRDWELQSGDLAIGRLEGDLIRQQVAQEIRTAARSVGSVPGGLERWAKTFLEPQIDWRRQLAAHVRSGIDSVSGAVDYSYRRPSRRLGSPIGRKVVLPALVQPLPRVAVVVDTSGSMDEELLQSALAEIRGLLRSSGVGVNRLTVLACDTAVHSTQQVFAVDQVRLLGGGGTNMGLGIATAERLRPKPEVIVVITDGFTPWPSVRPSVEVIVAVLGQGPEPPAWARMVRVD